MNQKELDELMPFNAEEWERIRNGGAIATVWTVDPPFEDRDPAWEAEVQMSKAYLDHRYGGDPPFEDRAPQWVHWDCALRDMAIYDFWVQVGIVALLQGRKE